MDEQFCESLNQKPSSDGARSVFHACVEDKAVAFSRPLENRSAATDQLIFSSDPGYRPWPHLHLRNEEANFLLLLRRDFFFFAEIRSLPIFTAANADDTAEATRDLSSHQQHF